MSSTKKIVRIALIAAIYFVISMSLQFMSFNSIQVRVAEALIVAAIVSKNGIYGVTIGCLITNAIGTSLGLSNFGILDVIFGTLFTAISCVLAYYLKNFKFGKNQVPYVSLMMPVLVNAIGLPFVFAFGYYQALHLPVLLFDFTTVFIGQFISCIIIGSILYTKYSQRFAEFLNN
ncbi:MAG: QueT transporter family protein [Erysipelothrix sp.]|nr:QueT transporter family protein [Erysipelothrix sp.]